MRQHDPDAFGALEHGDRRRCARDQSDDRPRGLASRRVRRIDQRVVDDRRAAHMGDAVLCDQFKNPGRIDFAQADVHTGRGSDGPGKTPAIAMEHRQRPEIDRMLAEIAGEDVADGVEVGAAVVGHDALGITRGPRGVAERNGVPFIFRRFCDETLIALRQRVFVFDRADVFSVRESGIVDIDDERFWSRHQLQRLGDHAGKFRIDQDDLRAAMIELEGDRGGIEPDVERIEHGAGHRYRKMYFVHGRDIRQHRRHGVSVPNAAAGEVRGKAPAARIGLRPREDAALVNRADLIGIDGGSAREKTQRRQRHKIGWRLVQTETVLALLPTHRSPPIRKGFKGIRSISTEKSLPQSGHQ